MQEYPWFSFWGCGFFYASISAKKNNCRCVDWYKGREVRIKEKKPEVYGETDQENVQRDLNGVKSSDHRHNWWALILFMV